MGKFITLESYNGEPVITEPGLEDCEQETGFHFSARTAKEGCIQVTSNNAPIVRGLLVHRDYVPEEIRAIRIDSAPKVIYTAGRLPMNCLRITASSGSKSIGKIITKSARSGKAEDPTESLDETPSEAPAKALQEVGV